MMNPTLASTPDSGLRTSPREQLTTGGIFLFESVDERPASCFGVLREIGLLSNELQISRPWGIKAFREAGQ